MTRTPIIRLIVATPFVVALAACGAETADTGDSAAAPAGDAPAEIKERQDNFEAISDSFKAVREQLETDAPDFAVIEPAAADIAERLKRVPDLFPAGSGMADGYDSEALATIWEDPDGFAEVSQKAIALGDEFAATAATGDAAALGEAVGKLGLGACKACHDKYRLDDD